MGQSTEVLADNYMRESSATRYFSYYCVEQRHGIQIAFLLKSSGKFRDFFLYSAYLTTLRHTESSSKIFLLTVIRSVLIWYRSNFYMAGSAENV